MQWLKLALAFMVDLLFGCRHAHLSRPFTIEERSYKICLDCGQEMPYSVEAMRLLRPWEVLRSERARRTATLPAPAHAGLDAGLQTVPAGKHGSGWRSVA
jgi:hypothetical protein